MHIAHRLVALVLFVICAAGCRSVKVYDLANGIPASERVVVNLPVMLDPLSLDGSPLQRDLMPSAQTYRLELAPGPHALVLRYSGLSDDRVDPVMVKSPSRTLEFVGEAGHTYRISYKVPQVYASQGDEMNDLKLWIEEEGRTNAASPAPSAAPKQAAVVTVVTPPAAPVAAPESSRLQREWENATPAERAEFLKWTGESK